MRHLLAFALFFWGATGLLVFSGTAGAQSSPNIPIDDPVYRDVDRLVGLGLAGDVIYGQRPWSRAEIARIVVKAAEKLKSLPEPVSPDDRELSMRVETSELLDRLKERFDEEINRDKNFYLHPLSYVQGEYTFVDSDTRTLTPSNGLGTIDAVISPLTAYREGRHYPDGHQFAVETEHYATLTRFFAVYARPRFQLEVRDNKDFQAHPFVQQLYGKFAIPHFELEIGRDSLQWGQGRFGGIVLSNNARPLDMIKISNPSPTVLPWVFKYLGPFRYTFFVANLGSEREFPRSFLSGVKVSFKPAAFVELGMNQTVMMGGRGAPGPLNAGNVLGEFFGFRSGNIRATNLSNRQMGFDLRFFFPFLRNSQLYLDVEIEDKSGISYMILNTTNYQAGFFIPRLTNDGAASLRLEYRHGAPYYARHAPFITGLTLNRRLLGDELGPQGDGMYIELVHNPSPKLRLSFDLNYERRNGDTLAEVRSASGDRDHLTVVTDLVPEHRIGLDALAQYTFTPRCRMDLELGYSYARNFNFLPREDRNSFLVRSAVRFDLF